MRLTRHFTFEELIATKSDLINTVNTAYNPTVVSLNIMRMASLLERFRYWLNCQRCIRDCINDDSNKTYFDCPIIVNSCFRNRAVNADVGGKSNSLHLQALAFDIHTPFTTAEQLYSLFVDFISSVGDDHLAMLGLCLHYVYKIDSYSIHCDFEFEFSIPFVYGDNRNIDKP